MIDLLNGLVVHAKRGSRADYLPIRSSLTESTKPIDIVKAFMDIYPFTALYIADLNAIQSIDDKSHSNRACIDEIHTSYPHLTIWIDASINTLEKAEEWGSSYIQLVLGSESFSTLTEYQSLISKLDMPFYLSLDFTVHGYTGPEMLLHNTQYWPDSVIAMTLPNVGANNGIDQQTLLSMRSKSKTYAIYAAGGVRNIEDLHQLKTLGIKGALIASALHNKQINKSDLINFFRA